ncbi:hypothetical protein L596_018705 [Steinernema carpocapsae]|uniref:Amino acid transporter transmembrane domain-containing protein n=1 Tax=Steinernema carpocapsae TaxID=34508 RepID=A0A4U5N693_STECR|nr:hypothetical protein L596_018705 [Steinernema carpocapsae]
MQNPTAGRRLQDWTNRNIFAKSFDSFDLPASSYQNAPAAGSTGEAGPDCEALDDETRAINATSDDGHGASSDSPITAYQAAWNVTNAIQGMFIVGLPVAVKVGGWWSVGAMIGVAYVCYWTGALLIECLYEGGSKVRHSYKDVADAVKPGLGKLVMAAQLTELLSTCILYVVLAGDLLQSCVPSIDKTAWMMLTTAVLLATAFLDDIAIVSHLSLANAISHLVINAVFLLYCLSQVSDWVWSEVRFSLDLRTFPTMIGVVVFGYTSHIFLPSIEASMKNPSEFKWMLKWSHIMAAVFKAIFGLMGFLTFGEFTQKEISNSLPNQSFKVLINLVLVVKALLSYPLPYYATVQLLRQNFFRGTKFTWFSSCYGNDRTLREWALCLRIILILFTLMMALSVPYLIELMGLVGNITGTMLSFIWPALFHLKLKGARLTDFEKKFDLAVIGLGVTVCVVGIYYSAIELATAIRYGEG